MPATDLWLFRPADTDWDQARRLQGNVDLPATEESLTELRSRVARLAEGPELLFHAPGGCAAESARVVAGRFGCRAVQVQALADPDLGLLQGLTMADFERRFGSRFAEWTESPLTVSPPEGEPMSEARARILDAFAGILAAAPGRRVGIVLHVVALATVRDALAGGDGSRLWSRVEGRAWFTRYAVPADAAAMLGD
jgi:probable phosphoglycerate mutase